jgi:DNA primase
MTPSLIAEALDRHSLAEVAWRTGIPIAVATGAVTVHCPLPCHGHPDRTPSLRLYLDDGHYYCFGCGARGDVIQWVRDAEGVGFNDAIRLLDSGRPITNTWAGVARESQNGLAGGQPRQQTGDTGEAVSQAELPDLHRTHPERVRAALQSAWSYYTYRPLHARAAAYLARRGIDVAVLEGHTGRTEIGHTPAKHDGLVCALRTKSFSDDELVDAGLAHRRLGTTNMSDFYRQRVLIPLRDDQGRVCGLIGRNVGDVRWPKYKNPPATHTYEKSVNLYQPLPAARRRDGHIIVVEGTLDAMAIAVAAVRWKATDRFCPLTQSGRELSEFQVGSILKLHAGSILISFDGDAPGRDSNRRLLAAIRARGRHATVIRLPDGADPASLLARSGPAGLNTWSSHSLLLAAPAAHTSLTTPVPRF